MAERIDHVAEAIKTVDETLSYGGYGDDAGAVASMLAAQVHATLALAEQQRIANIIALSAWQELGPNDGRIRVPSFGPDGTLRADIRESLGL